MKFVLEYEHSSAPAIARRGSETGAASPHIGFHVDYCVDPSTHILHPPLLQGVEVKLAPRALTSVSMLSDVLIQVHIFSIPRHNNAWR